MLKPALVLALIEDWMVPSLLATAEPPAFQFQATYFLLLTFKLPGEDAGPVNPSLPNALRTAVGDDVDVSSTVVLFVSNFLSAPLTTSDKAWSSV